ncbi:MAG: glycosyltransferase family 2 protein, partial [Planctomycetota bacterium]
MPDLSVIIVNYNSGNFCTQFIESLLDQEFVTPGGKPGELELIVVDNASPDDQHGLLDPLAERGVHVIYSKENLGYSGGNNVGMRHAHADRVMVSNPDVLFMPGALQRLMDVMYAHPEAGMVGPISWLDPGFHFMHPPMQRTDIRLHLSEYAGRVFKTLGRWYSLKRSRYALNYWTGADVVRTRAISGFCFCMPADLAKRLGPFDSAFPFYYEDDDLSVRVEKAGYKLLFVRNARVVHFFNKSAGPVYEEVLGKYYRSKNYFFQKHAGPVGHWLYKVSTNFFNPRMARLKGSHFMEIEDLGTCSDPFELDLPEGEERLVELTLDRAFVLAAGHIHPGGTYRIPDATWDALD